MMKNKIVQTKPTKRQAIDRLLEQLPFMERKSLLKHWRDLFGRGPSPALRRETLIPILAYGIQEHAFGGLKESTARKLRELANDSAAQRSAGSAPLRAKFGTRYVREYDGKLHEVTVLETGYEFEGTTYRSLTEIAKIITGSKWSGPVFFGQKRKVRRTI
jgi:hypothetical protein